MEPRSFHLPAIVPRSRQSDRAGGGQRQRNQQVASPRTNYERTARADGHAAEDQGSLIPLRRSDGGARGTDIFMDARPGRGQINQADIAAMQLADRFYPPGAGSHDVATALVATARQVGAMEDRMMHQETTLRRLLERAFEIQNEFETSYKSMAQGFEESKKERLLLHDHVKNTTEMVKHLTELSKTTWREVQSMEERMKNHSHSIKQLDANVHTIASEMRQRFTICEADITMLSKQLGAANEEVYSMKADMKKEGASLEQATKQMREQFAAIQSRMTSYETELHDFRKHTEVELERCVASMDHRSRDIIENTRLAITNAIGHAASERDRLKATVTERCNEVDMANQKWRAGVESLVSESVDRLQSIIASESQAAQKFRDTLQRQVEALGSRQKRMLLEHEQECSRTLLEAQRSLTSMHGLLETREKVLKEEVILEFERLAKEVVIA